MWVLLIPNFLGNVRFFRKFVTVIFVEKLHYLEVYMFIENLMVKVVRLNISST